MFWMVIGKEALKVDIKLGEFMVVEYCLAQIGKVWIL